MASMGSVRAAGSTATSPTRTGSSSCGCGTGGGGAVQCPERREKRPVQTRFGEGAQQAPHGRRGERQRERDAEGGDGHFADGRVPQGRGEPVLPGGGADEEPVQQVGAQRS